MRLLQAGCCTLETLFRSIGSRLLKKRKPAQGRLRRTRLNRGYWAGSLHFVTDNKFHCNAEGSRRRNEIAMRAAPQRGGRRAETGAVLGLPYEGRTSPLDDMGLRQTIFFLIVRSALWMGVPALSADRLMV